MTETTSLTAVTVPDEQRLEFLPSFFGPGRMLRGESLVYGWLNRLSSDYGGGFWAFRTVSNGAMYMAPRSTTGYRLSVAGNGFDGVLSPDAAGVVATLFALNQLAVDTEDDRLIDLYHLLRDFAFEHAEGGLIMQAID